MSDLRYESVPQQFVDFCEAVRLKHFVNLDGARVLYIFDNKVKKAAGRIAFAWIKKTNDELKFLAMNDDGVTYDYVMFFNKDLWDLFEDRDRERLVFHEFCHCEVDFEKVNPYGIKDHEIQGFYDEADFNFDDLRWTERLSLMAESFYDPENDQSDGVEAEGSTE